MGLHEEILRQLLNAIEQGKKLAQIKTLTDELKDVCDKLENEKNNLMDKIKKDQELDDVEKARIKKLNDRYNSAMSELNELILGRK